MNKLLVDALAASKEIRARIRPESIGDTQDGVTLLECKAHSLLSYLTNLCFLLLLKVQGEKISGHPAVKQLAELRVVIEKMRPMESKLKYQIDKLVKAAAVADDKARHEFAGNRDNGASEDEDEELMYAPNPKALVGNQEAKVGKELHASEISRDAVYRPPRIAPQHFERDKTKLTKTQKKIANESRLLADLKTQYSSQPEVHSSQGTGYGDRTMSNKLDKMIAEKEAFEEEHFIRANLTRKDKQLRKKVAKHGAMLRFKDEFKELSSEFTEIEGVERALKRQQEADHGTSVLGKANRSRNSIKRKYENVSDMLSAAKNAGSGPNEFRKRMKQRSKK